VCPLAVVVASRRLGDGRIDNFVIDRSVHLATGAVVLVTLVAATALVARHAWRDEGLGRRPSSR